MSEFFSDEWAEAARQAINAGPDTEARAKKIDRFWEWIDQAKEKLDCTLAIGVEGLPGDKRDCIVFTLEQGVATEAKLTHLDEGAEATYLLCGSYEDWKEIMAGFDMGKTIMYRKLLLEQGEVLLFFRSIFYWTESLACVQRIPTSFAA